MCPSLRGPAAAYSRARRPQRLHKGNGPCSEPRAQERPFFPMAVAARQHLNVERHDCSTPPAHWTRHAPCLRGTAWLHHQTRSHCASAPPPLPSSPSLSRSASPVCSGGWGKHGRASQTPRHDLLFSQTGTHRCGGKGARCACAVLVVGEPEEGGPGTRHLALGTEGGHLTAPDCCPPAIPSCMF